MDYKRPNKLEGLSSLQLNLAKEKKLLNFDIPIKERSIFSIIKKNLFTFFNFISLAIAILLVFVRSYRNLLFLGVVFSNLLIGTYQEIKAKRISEKLRLMNKHSIRCKRDGKTINVYSNELALYDLIILERGEQVPSDCELEAGECSVDESVLSGENEAVAKSEGDILLSGSFITEGSVLARVIRINKDNYISKIQLEANQIKEPKSELLKQINYIVKIATIIIIPVGAILFYSMSKTSDINNSLVIINSISAALIGMIPSGLVLLTSVALAMGIINLSKQNVLINELSAIENLARIDTLCLDKTGTITSGDMQLHEIIPFDCTYDYAINALKCFLINNSDNNNTLDAIRKGIGFYERRDLKQKESVSFSSTRKWSSVYYNGDYYCLGASANITTNTEILKRCDIISETGKRVLVLGKTNSKIKENTVLLDEIITIICIICIKDEIRSDASETIKYFYDQDVNIKLISGDNLKTLKSIANSIGIKNSNEAIHNDDIQKNIDIENISLFGRVSPENKKYIVSKLKKNNHTVAMCGDGVNDLPALKAADCSISMGSGNDAVKSISQIVLINNNFNIMPSIVNEGRRVINNINLCASLFLNKTFLSAFLSIICVIFSYSYPFQPIQLTLISSLTIGIPSFFYAIEPNKKRVQKSFLLTILKNSIPTSLAACIGFVFLQLILKNTDIKTETISTIYTIVISILLFVSLVDISRPLTKLRISIILVLIALFIIIYLFFGSFFYFVTLYKTDYFAIIYTGCISILSYFLVKKVVNKF